jgi:hypothetical protein
MKKVVRLTESELINVIKRIITEGQSEIDSILDKINRVGFDGLTPKEQSYLRHYSETGEFKDDEELVTRSQSFDYEHKFSNKIDGVDMTFKYESTEDTPDEMIHSGYLEINNDEFYGEIYCDIDGTYSTCNFEDGDGVNLFEKYEGLEHEVEYFLDNVCEEIKGNEAV